MERHKRRWSVIYEGDIGSAWEWCQIKLHTSCDASVPLNQLETTDFDGAQSISALAVVVICKFFEYFLKFFHKNENFSLLCWAFICTPRETR